MPIIQSSLTAPTVAPGGAGSESVSFSYTAPTWSRLDLVAINEDGERTVVGSETFINLGTGGTRTIVFEPNDIADLDDGNYTFQVQVTPLIGPGFTGPTSGETFICFLQGTLIRTAAGEVAVEDLRPVDLVLTADGRQEPVVFVGRQSIHPKFGVPEAKNPILIRAGALGENLPARDLRVSPGHGLVVDGVLCIAAALVNGVSIVQEATPQEVFAYYNVELAAHEVILAEGAPVESFADNVPRERFDNFAEFQARFPEGREVGEMDLPRAMSRRQVPAATLARLEARAAALFGTTEKAAA